MFSVNSVKSDNGEIWRSPSSESDSLGKNERQDRWRGSV